MKLANPMILIPDKNIPAAILLLVAKIMLLMAVGGLLGNAWALPGGPCMVDQIEREPFNRRGLPKKAFTIILNDLATGTGLWKAPYKVDTGGNTGWISAERTGYRAAYMFLVDQNTAEVLARVFFVRASKDAGYVQVNDKYMAEGQNTGIHFDGSCNYVSQAGSPFASEEYEPDNSPDARPIILLEYQGEIVEDRSYTNTTGEAIEQGLLRFRDGGFIDEPFMVADGFGNASLVFQRQTVIASYDANRDGNFQPAVVVYYDVLSPKVNILQEDPRSPGN